MPKRLLIFILLSFISFCSFVYAEDKIKIGISLPLSGEAQIYGDDIREFLQFANKDLAQDKYILVFEDNKCSPKEAVSNAQKLINIDKVKYVLGLPCSGTVLSSAPIYEKAGVITITTFASSPKIRDLGPHTFRTYPNDAEAATLLANYVLKNKYAVAILSEQTDYAEDLKSSFVTEIEKSGQKVLVEDFLPATLDFRTQLAKLKQKNPDVLFINPQAEATFANIMKQLKQLNWQPKILGAYWPGSPEVIKIVGNQLNGTVYADTPSLNNILNDQGQGVLKRYNDQGGHVRSTEAVFATSYEAFRALNEVISSAGDPLEYLNTHEWDGLFGKWKFDQDGEIQGISLILKTIENGSVKDL